MKKSMIAAGTASVALAAMPIVGVFAATSTSFTDNLTVTVPSGCTLEDATAGTDPGTYVDPGTYANRTFVAEINAGTYQELTVSDTGNTGTNMRIACNTGGAGTWTVTADSTGVLTGTTGAAQTNSATIPAGVAISGGDSAWAIKSNASNNATTDPYVSYKAYDPDIDTSDPADGDGDIATFLTGSASADVTFSPSYRVYVAPDQDTGDYTGSVTYTVAMNS